MKPLFMFWGKVVSGMKRGKLLGFPTANIRLHKKIPEGIYISEVIFAGKKYMAATFIGPAKTYGEDDYKAECYILDFDRSIYGSWLSVRLFTKIRENEKFTSEKDLVKKMQEDILATRRFFS